MRYRAFIAALVLIAGITGCASRDDVNYLRRDMEEAKNRLYKMEKDIAGIRLETREGAENAVKGFQSEIDNLRKTIADLQATQDMLRVDIQSLSGRVDDVKQLALKPTEEIALLKEDTDRRLLAIEGKVVATEHKPAVEEKTVEGAPEKAYQSALDEFRNGEMKKSRESFKKFIGLYPKHDLASNAQFWIGETYYNEKNLEQAILEYQEVIKNYPGKEKTAAALLKQAMAFKGLGDDKSARYIYKKLIDEYPRTDEASKAKERLKSIK